MTLKIIKTAHKEIYKAAEDSFPDECCGFLLGRDQFREREVIRILAASNTRKGSARTHRFLITPEAFRQAEQIAKDQGMEVIGFYHSHPNAAAQPSEYDLEHAWPWYSYVIISVKNSHAEEMTTWRLCDDRSQFEQEKTNLI